MGIESNAIEKKYSMQTNIKLISISSINKHESNKENIAMA